MSLKDYPSIDYVRQCLRYEDGQLFWLTRSDDHFRSIRDAMAWNTRFAGKEAGMVMWLGRDRKIAYRYVRFKGKAIVGRQTIRYASIVWAFHHDEWRLLIDHVDRDTLNDRIENLRPATCTQNSANKTLGQNNSSGFKGVSRGGNRWLARVQSYGKKRYLGSFPTPELAHEAYMKAARELFGEFACDGK